MSNTPEPLVIGIVGLGGFAATITNVVLDIEAEPNSPVHIAAACDPALDQHADRAAVLRDHGIQVFDNLDEMLQVDAIQAIWLPVPIDLHRPFMEKALAAGKAVLCEKPAAGTVDEVDAMIAARDRANHPVIVGFQHVYDSTTLPLKRQLLAGDIGPVRRAVVHGRWPRSTTYYSRATWAGCMKRGDNWVLDSPAQNAMAHFVNLALFLLGPDEASIATPLAVEAELYRARSIENYDTLSARVTLDQGTELLILLTHACAQTAGPTLHIQGERGSITRASEHIEVQSPAGATQLEIDGRMYHRMLQQFARLIQGQPPYPDIALSTLESARRHTVLINGISEAAPVHTVPDNHIQVTTDDTGSEVYAITDIDSAFDHCAANHLMLHESSRLPFTHPAGKRDLRNYTHFAGPHPDNATHPATTSDNA